MIAKMKLKKGDMVIVNSGSEKGKKGQESGIIERECPIDASKVSFYCDKCEKGVRLGINVAEDGTKTRFCKKCQEVK